MQVKAMDHHLESRFEEHYELILRLARGRLAREPAPVSTMTLAHELYLNLQGRGDLEFQTREQFLAYASRAMRSLLIDMARERMAQKRNAHLLPLTAGGHVPDFGASAEQFIELDAALTQLERVDARLTRVAEMRVVMGMEVDDIALALGVSSQTIKRDWQRAKAYLYEALGIPLP